MQPVGQSGQGTQGLANVVGTTAGTARAYGQQFDWSDPTKVAQFQQQQQWWRQWQAACYSQAAPQASALPAAAVGLAIGPTDPRLQGFIRQVKDHYKAFHLQFCVQNGYPVADATTYAENALKHLETTNSNHIYSRALYLYQEQIQKSADAAVGSATSTPVASSPAPVTTILAEAKNNAAKTKRNRFDITPQKVLVTTKGAADAQKALNQPFLPQTPQPPTPNAILPLVSQPTIPSQSVVPQVTSFSLYPNANKPKYDAREVAATARRNWTQNKDVEKSAESNEVFRQWIDRLFQTHQIRNPKSDSDRLSNLKVKKYCDYRIQEAMKGTSRNSIDWSMEPVPSYSEIEAIHSDSTTSAQDSSAQKSRDRIRFYSALKRTTLVDRSLRSNVEHAPNLSARSRSPRHLSTDSSDNDDSSRSQSSPKSASRGMGLSKGTPMRTVFGGGDGTSDINPLLSGLSSEDFIPLTPVLGRGRGRGRGRGLARHLSKLGSLLDSKSENGTPTTKAPFVSNAEKRKRDERMKRFDCTTLNGEVPDMLRMTWEEQVSMMKSCRAIVGQNQALEKQYLRLTGPPDPALVRPEAVLRKSFQHVVQCWTSNAKSFRWTEEQFRSIRQDVTVQRIKNEFTIRVYETNARICLENQDLGQFNQCQTQLRDLHKNVPVEPRNSHKVEFLCYRILYLALQNMRFNMVALWGELSDGEVMEPSIRYALDVRKAITEANYHRLFRLVPKAPWHAGFLIRLFVPKFRMLYLCTLCRGTYSLPIQFLARQLEFPTIQECAAFLGSEKAVWQAGQFGRVLDCRKSCPVFEASQLLVSKKVKAMG